jgi:multiple sugar transport system permease protein
MSDQHRKWNKRFASEMTKHLLICIVLGFVFLPLYVMVMTSFKSNHEFFINPWRFPEKIEWSNWAVGWSTIKDYIATTFVVSTISVLLIFCCAFPGAYFFARAKIPFKKFCWFIFVSLLMMPLVTNLLPLFSLLKSLNMLNSIWALSFVVTAGAQVGTVFWLRGFIEELPKDLFEAAEIDGASHFYQMTNIVLPLSTPILATLAITRFIHAWNEFLLPLLLITDPNKQMLAVGLMQLDSQYLKHYGQLMSAYTIASVPLILLFLSSMRLFIQGLMRGAVKE